MSNKNQNLLKNVKQKFAEAREKCPGMSDDVYALTDYISTVANDELVPMGLIMCMTLVLDDLQKGRNGFNPGEPLPEYLNQHRNQLISQMANIPQVVDAIADEKFATEFRQICKETFGFNTPKRVFANTDSTYPEYVQVAIDWWANAVQSPKFDNGGDVNPFLIMMISGNRKSHTEEEIKIFKECLAKNILSQIKEYGSCSLSVDYDPCDILADAGNKIGLNSTNYPWKTWMIVSDKIVEVSEGWSSGRKTIWSKEKNNDLDKTTAHNAKHR